MDFKNISLELTNKELSCNSGLVFFDKLFEDLKLSKRLKRILPRKKKKIGPSQINKVKALIYSFASGADSLSDLDDLNGDVLFNKLTGGGIPSRTMGDFLRSFSKRKIQLLQELLVDMAFSLRLSAYPHDRKFTLTMDSTSHEHLAQKKEGMSWNYKNLWCLDSQNAYDQYGFSYCFDLRPGNTHSGKHAELWIRRVYSRIPETMEKYFRADSAYGKHAVYHALEAAKVKFAIVLKENVSKYVRNWNKNFLTWKNAELYFFGSKTCEISSGLYPVKNFGNFRVVFVRVPKKDHQLELFDDSDQRYNYYSIITNFNAAEMTEEEVVEFYRKRANAENFIREQKYGFDFLNFPCQKLSANNVYGIFGSFCHNMMRYLSFCLSQKVKKIKGKDGTTKTVIQRGYFSKKVRFSLIKLPCQVVSHARRVKLKINRKTKEVFENVMRNIHILSFLPDTS